MTQSANCILFYGDTLLPGLKSAGAFRIATVLRNKGYTVKTVDASSYRTPEGFEEMKFVIKDFIGPETFWVGFSTTFLYSIVGYPFARTPESFEKRWPKKPDIHLNNFIKYIRDINPDIEFIAGGSRRFLLEDYGFKIFRGYNDTEIVTFTDWCADKKKSTLDLDVKGPEIFGKEYKDFFSSVIEYKKEDVITPIDTLPIEISRGCIFKCKFCSFPLNGKSKGDWIKHSSVLRYELTRNYEQFGVNTYIFSDDTYNDSLDKLKLLYDEVFSKLPFQLDFTAYIRLDLLVRFPEMVTYLAQSGLKSALFGIETINHASGKSIGKGLDPMVQFQFIEEIKKNEWKDILTYSGFMLGLPHDTHEDLDKFEEFIFSDKNKLDTVKVDPMYLHPPKYKHLNRIYYSEFDHEYEKYGYECYEQIDADPWTEVRWRNNITGMNFDDTYARAKSIEWRASKSPKFKVGGFMYSYYKSLGVPSEDLLTLSNPEIEKKYDFERLKQLKIQNYKMQFKDLNNKP